MKRAPADAGRRGQIGSDQPRNAEIIPPEGVPLHFEIAGLGGRLAAQLIDIVITVGLAVAIILLIILIFQSGAGASLLAIAAFLFFLVRAPYYVAAELLWNGQTIGKRICALRVISARAAASACIRSSPET